MGGINEQRQRCLEWIMESLNGLRASRVDHRLERGPTHVKD